MFKGTLKNPFVDKTGVASGSIFIFDQRKSSRNNKYNPHASGYVLSAGSGSFTAQIDHLRQGVSVINDFFKVKSVLPTFDFGDPDSRMMASGSKSGAPTSGIEEKFIIGQTKQYRTEGPFIDKANLEKIGATEGLFAFAQGSIPTSSFYKLDYPIVQPTKRYHISDLLNGTIDTFNRTYAAYTPKILSRSLAPIDRDPNGGISADIMGGNLAYKKGSDQISNLIPLQMQSTSSAPFIDSLEKMGGIKFPDRQHSIGKTSKLPDQYVPVPFDDSKFANRMFSEKSLEDLDSDFFFTVVENISGSSDRMVPEGFKSAATGFIFTNNGINLDSVAFGGMKRDA